MFKDDDLNKTTSFYSPIETFTKGNVEKRTYEQFDNYQPLMVEANNEQSKLFIKIQLLGFNVFDLGLYLNTHPNDKDALDLFSRYQVELRGLIKEYEEKYGAFTIGHVKDKLPYEWLKGPWPWEN